MFYNLSVLLLAAAATVVMFAEDVRSSSDMKMSLTDNDKMAKVNVEHKDEIKLDFIEKQLDKKGQQLLSVTYYKPVRKAKPAPPVAKPPQGPGRARSTLAPVGALAAATPAAATPAAATPAETTPAEATSAEATSAETTPVEATSAESASAEATSSEESSPEEFSAAHSTEDSNLEPTITPSPPLPPPFPIPEPSETEQMPPQTTSSSTDEELIPDDYEEEDEEKKESYKKTGRAKPTTLGEALGSEAEGTEEALTGEGVENEVTETEDEQTAAEVVTEIPEKGVGPEPSHVDVTTAEESYEKDLGWPDLDITPTEQTVVQATQTPEKSNHELGGEGKAGATSDSAEGGSREVTKGLTKGSMTEETDDGYDVWVMPTVPFPGRRMLTESEISPFTVYDDDADWATADRNCANRGSELAVPRDDADKASIEALLNNKAQAAEAWVGLRQVVGDEVFRDKSGVCYNNNGQMNCPKHFASQGGCAVLTDASVYKSRMCNQKLPYVCHVVG